MDCHPLTFPANFNRLAKLYRWLEYLTLGPLLQQTRTALLAEVAGSRRALILGDGDGRFTQALFRANPLLQAEAVDASAAMLQALRHRTPAPGLRTTKADLRSFKAEEKVDLITTHFVLDCLTDAEAVALITRLVPCLTPGGFWLISEFRVPDGALRWPARVYLRLLYLAFRVLTGLRVTHLPEYASALQCTGLRLVQERRHLFGLLTSQLWTRNGGQLSRTKLPAKP